MNAKDCQERISPIAHRMKAVSKGMANPSTRGWGTALTP